MPLQEILHRAPNLIATSSLLPAGRPAFCVNQDRKVEYWCSETEELPLPSSDGFSSFSRRYIWPVKKFSAETPRTRRRRRGLIPGKLASQKRPKQRLLPFLKGHSQITFRSYLDH